MLTNVSESLLVVIAEIGAEIINDFPCEAKEKTLFYILDDDSEGGVQVLGRFWPLLDLGLSVLVEEAEECGCPNEIRLWTSCRNIVHSIRVWLNAGRFECPFQSPWPSRRIGSP